MSNGLTLEIVEGPGAGKQARVSRAVVIGRAPDADLVLEDGEVSRHHAKVTPGADGSAVVEDLGSVNGTFLNRNELVGPARLDAGDELLLGVTLLQLRTADDLIAQPSAVRAVPPGLVTAPRAPSYVNPAVERAEGGAAAPQRNPALDKYIDVRVRRRAQLAPLAVFALVALALILFFALR